MRWKIPILNGLNFSILLLIIANVGWYFVIKVGEILFKRDEILYTLATNKTISSEFVQLADSPYLGFNLQLLFLFGGFFIGLMVGILIEKIFNENKK